ncbi:MAG: hypothetical protein VB962_12755, partial [Pseudohongiellaceae bacterium]
MKTLLITSPYVSCLMAFAVALLVPVNSTLAQVPIIQPGAPGQPSRVISAEEASDLANIQY